MSSHNTLWGPFLGAAHSVVRGAGEGAAGCFHAAGLGSRDADAQPPSQESLCSNVATEMLSDLI